MSSNGARQWFFADGYLPEKKAPGAMEAHEALMILNCTSSPASVKLDVYFDNRAPIKDIPVSVEAERVRTLRLDHPSDLAGHAIPPLTQYALRVRSDVPVVVQFGRLDTTQPNMAYYVGVGYCSE